MDMLAHGLWTAAGAVAARRASVKPIRMKQVIWWGVFPDALAFGPSAAAGLALWLIRGGGALSHDSIHVHLGLALYPAAHSLILFAATFAALAMLRGRIAYAMLGWLLHILIDIPTHSYAYYATRFLWPISEVRVDGMTWWTPWFWGATYGALALVYLVLWRKGWLKRARAGEAPRESISAMRSGL